MENFVKKIVGKATVESFTVFTHYQPKMPDFLMEKAQAKNKKED